MKPRMIWANLASADLKRTTEFYTKLEFMENDNNNSEELTSLVFGENKFVINFFKKERLEFFTNGKIVSPEMGNEIIFSLSAKNRDEVDQWSENVKKAGGKIISEPQNYELGYTFVFSDPDGHKFNVLYWPGM
ncbi:VOC family protein [Flavobacterium gilvum]|uniref:Glyoxalase n=1 Tax=Flavobacterium gilvum TaxID=1492737 RepID=A0AAC9I5S4_9FLAO|nr:VOC family protein [Flavobacterium gilvum]AOW09891.1 glyoxalase [Flavobacterium gilvum]KFC57613.1 glyoxalase/bleomycin resistance protein/dioxygenase [Flavobacterium gilvum]